ncbi:hypothetical protein X743_15090 [Mesorhizobium sp. LNHC252B00]|nr:hypothetical protein X743_15090 [Mesorhizobium sp. LNHC252B00]
MLVSAVVPARIFGLAKPIKFQTVRDNRHYFDGILVAHVYQTHIAAKMFGIDPSKHLVDGKDRVCYLSTGGRRQLICNACYLFEIIVSNTLVTPSSSKLRFPLRCNYALSKSDIMFGKIELQKFTNTQIYFASRFRGVGKATQTQ